MSKSVTPALIKKKSYNFLYQLHIGYDFRIKIPFGDKTS